MKFLLHVLLPMGVFILFPPNQTSAQCAGSSQSPFSTVTVDNTGSVTSIDWCNTPDEYSVTTGYLSGNIYEWSSSIGPDYLTLTTDAAGSNVLVSGVTPISYTSTGEDPLYLHVHSDASCGTQGFCRETSVQCTFCFVPGNNTCSGATVVGVGTTSGDTSPATTADDPGACGDSNNFTAPGLWYSYFSNGPETFTVDICGANFDSQLSVWTGACGSLTCIDGEDDDVVNCLGNIDDPHLSIYNLVESIAPVEYKIYVYGFNNGTGSFDLNISSVPLPTELISFEGIAMEAGNRLTWSTAAEFNTEYHAIQRSIDGQDNWRIIGITEAKGTEGGLAKYEFLDDRPLAKAYYRLLSVDYDRSESFSEIVQLERKTGGFTIANVFPNPTRGSVILQYNSEENTDVDIIIMDISGKVLQQFVGQAENRLNNLNIAMEDLSAGTYFISLSNGLQTVFERVVKQ